MFFPPEQMAIATINPNFHKFKISFLRGDVFILMLCSYLLCEQLQCMAWGNKYNPLLSAHQYRIKLYPSVSNFGAKLSSYLVPMAESGKEERRMMLISDDGQVVSSRFQAYHVPKQSSPTGQFLYVSPSQPTIVLCNLQPIWGKEPDWGNQLYKNKNSTFEEPNNHPMMEFSKWLF